MIARLATPDDADELIRLRAVLLTSMNPPTWDDAWRTPSRETLTTRLAAPGLPSQQPASHPASHLASHPASHPTSHPTSHPASHPASPPTLAAFVVDRPDGTGLAACAVGTVEHRLGSPGDPQGRTGYVFSVATDPDMRRRGFSRQCMTALLEWFQSQGVRKVDLRASAEAEPLYRSLGFARTPDPAMRLRLDP
jgi:GNAT superfamily N-acetyltransferase